MAFLPHRQSSRFSDIRSVTPSSEFMSTKKYPLYTKPLSKQFSKENILYTPISSASIIARKEKQEEQGKILRKKRKIFLQIAIVMVIIFSIYGIVHKISDTEQKVLADGETGFRSLLFAVENIKSGEFDKAHQSFENAYQAFSRGEKRLLWFGGSMLRLTRFVPGLSQVASGSYVLESGKHFSLAGISSVAIIEELFLSKEASAQGEKVSWLDFFSRVEKPLEDILAELTLGNQSIEKVHLDDIPEEKREQFLLARKSLPTTIGLIKSVHQNKAIIQELLGGNGPRKYLFLLQNNQELRATGGFIGTYALMDIQTGSVKQFFVDGIFNPDGQLKENIVPPKPIQKISAAWSLHDSNWFPDFPTSAEKAIFFYEKTGGPTVDGVITLTPTVMQKLLVVTGPITLPQYGITVDAENFIPIIQEQVETKYDKEENQPKKVLADLTALLVETVLASQDKETLYGMMSALTEGLNEKQILIYMRHAETEALIDEAGWSGRILSTEKDYLSVVHSNINGYKTDGVIDETIHHSAEIQENGSIIDTVTITRIHKGGDTPYDWWNKVNADYMRVYVPEGSTLLSAKGSTWEFGEDPLDYKALGFRVDVDVEREEKSITVDEKTGTRIYSEAGKTVFGGWVYVSPQESVVVEYRYLLPFTLDMSNIQNGGVDSYTTLFQKQSGSIGSKLLLSVHFPNTIEPVWQTGGNLIPYNRQWKWETNLKTDVFSGMVFNAKK
ncbi:MAG: DUF4012 domain-containing protein [Candidatus Moranbacteria bacterium]|nr:DUF4012 domain-containing protein [Candidatus Moranbacteria bacterium]MDD3964805.1 DUF4012 domain-containing protein [Candidatus Moranbacteria bacterium]